MDIFMPCASKNMYSRFIAMLLLNRGKVISQSLNLFKTGFILVGLDHYQEIMKQTTASATVGIPE